ncbi:MAG: TRAP transporter small permease [Rehaibacterium terrae]|uniref:TRAP transporter small permease n=1 Tax=Rehaibacterium terrae TaxID=1341696 RepID=UPI00391D5945
MTDTASATPDRDALGRALDLLARLAIALAAAALLGLVVVQGWQVFARYLLNASPSWTEPVTLLLLATAMGFGAAAGVRDNRHFGFFLLAEAAGPRGRRLFELLGAAVMLLLGMAMAGWSARLLLDGWDVRLAGAPLPQSINFLPLALGGALIALFALDRLRRAWRPRAAAGEG